VYYRVISEGSVLEDKPWTKVELTGSLPAPDETGSIFREHSYLIGGRTGNILPFTQFQLKFVMNSKSSSKVPAIKNLRVIALAV
jgi:hypothetical protein